MRVFGRTVSERDYMQAPIPTDTDLAVLAYCLGVQTLVGMPVLLNLRVTQKVTGNPRLRYIFELMIGGIEIGTHDSIQEPFANHPDVFSEEFIRCFKRPNPGLSLLKFSQRDGRQPASILANAVERPAATREMTNLLHTHYRRDTPLARTLQDIEQQCSSKTGVLIGRLRALLIREPITSNAFYALMDDYFDYFYMSVINCALGNDKLAVAFTLLATP